MHALRFTLTLCAFSACWYPLSWTSLSKYIIYTIYRILLICLISAFAISQFINFLFNIDKSDEITDNLYMSLTVTMAAYKLITMWIIDKNIIALINAFTEKPFKPSELPEIIIRQKYDKAIKKYALWYFTLIEITVVCVIINAVVMDLMKGNLSYGAWLPFDYTPPVIFYFVFTHQLVGVAITANTNIACDSLVAGFLQQICCQFDILAYRLTKILNDPNMLRDCVRHHDRIYKFAYMVNRKFVLIIGFQFVVSLLVVCANLYKLSSITKSINGQFFTILYLVLYTCCILSQIFIYCWFGNQLKLKSLEFGDAVYNMEWQKLNNKQQKDLMMFMKRSIPIEFNSAIIITLNLNSFMSLLKASYSAFNVLQHSQQEHD